MKAEWLGAGLPGKTDAELTGRLIAIEGTDCTGRSTQMRLLHEWLEQRGFGVVSTSLCRSGLAESGLRKAKRRNEVGRRTLALFYATDLADRLEREIVPALESGFIVLADRYVPTILARYAVRGLDPDWLRRVYGFALAPHLTCYLDVRLPVLARRALLADRMGYWESGMDMSLAIDRFESFHLYQRQMIRAFNRLVDEYGMVRVKANGNINRVQNQLRKHVEAVLADRAAEVASDGPAVVPKSVEA